MKNYFLKLNQLNTWLKLGLASALLFANCTSDTDVINSLADASNGSSYKSSKSVELPVYGITSDAEQHKDSYIDLAIDDDEDSKWLAYGDEIYVDLDLQYIQTVDYVKISFYEGDDKAFKFEVYALVDGEFTRIGSKRSVGTNTNLEIYDLTNADTNILRFKFKGNDVDLSNGVNDIEVWGTLLNKEVEPESTQNAIITDTSDADTGELRLNLSESIAVGKMSVTISKEATQDGFINLSGTSTSRGNALIDMRIDDKNGYEFTESGATVNALANFPTFVNDELVEVEISWDATSGAGILVNVTIDGQAVTDAPFLSESLNQAAILGGLKTVQFRLGGNSSLDATGAGMLVDNLKVYDTSSGADVIVFEDDFENYELGYSLDPDDAVVTSVANSPYKNNSFQATVQPTGSKVDTVVTTPPTDGYGPSEAATGEITWKNWYLSVPIDRADGSGKATSIYYNDILTNNLTDEERTYFDFNEDGSFKMDAKFTGYTTSGYYDSFASKYCRTELREYWQGNQTTSDNWYMDAGTHIMESTLSVQKAEGEAKVYVAQIHGTAGTSLSGTELTKGPATIKVQWYNDNIILEYYTVDGVVDGEWTSASGTVGKVTVGNVGNNKFTVRLKSEAGKFYMALYCEATGVDTGYIEYYDYLGQGYEYQNYFKTGNYFRHDEDYTSVSEVTLYSAVTFHE